MFIEHQGRLENHIRIVKNSAETSGILLRDIANLHQRRINTRVRRHLQYYHNILTRQERILREHRFSLNDYILKPIQLLNEHVTRQFLAIQLTDHLLGNYVGQWEYLCEILEYAASALREKRIFRTRLYILSAVHSDHYGCG